MSLILSPEQRAMRAYEARHSPQGQTYAATRMVERALDGLATDLGQEGGALGLPAVLNALLNNLVHHMAMLPEGERQVFVRNVCHAVPNRVEARLRELQREAQ
jgi:hypothetical protein